NVKQNNGVCIRNPPVDECIYTDASSLGWGAVCHEREAKVRWSNFEKFKHINELELKVVLFDVKS
ncbi:hypothetical protein NL293_28240, partial [Klebsiella pneumoniae]|nr:hypothetical protein [Klebsiella pneumoniae]